MQPAGQHQRKKIKTVCKTGGCWGLGEIKGKRPQWQNKTKSSGVSGRQKKEEYTSPKEVMPQLKEKEEHMQNRKNKDKKVVEETKGELQEESLPGFSVSNR